MIKSLKVFLFIFFTTLLLSFNLLNAAAPEERFEEANLLFKSAKYSQAIIIYDSLLKAGHRSSELYFNLAYSYSKMGETGKSILNLERALRYDPSNNRAQLLLVNENLKIKEKIAVIPQFFIFKFFDDVSYYMGSWGWLFIIFTLFIVGLVFLSGYILKRDFASNRNVMIFLPVFVVFQAVSVPAFIISYDREVNLREIVVLDENIILFEVPEDSGKREAQIYEGNKLRILNDISGWYLVQLSNGKEGWIIKKGVAGI